jgi:hypothetical protein
MGADRPESNRSETRSAASVRAARRRERKAALKSQLPRKADALFAWLLKQPQSEVLSLLAFCVAKILRDLGFEPYDLLK